MSSDCEKQQKPDRLSQLVLLSVFALCLLLAWQMYAFSQHATAERRQREAKFMQVWGQQAEPGLPAWAYSESQRKRLGLSLSGSQNGAPAEPALPRWSRERERRAFLRQPDIASISVPALGINDRCISCHQFSEDSKLPDPLLILAGQELVLQEAKTGARAEEATGLDTAATALPAATSRFSAVMQPAAHPGAWLLWHSPERFGCSSCHGGQGSGSTLAESGHRGYIPPPWSAKANPHASPATLIHSAPELWASCGRCHPGDTVPGNPLLSEGRQLARWLNCAGCHKTGPNLAALPAALTASGAQHTQRAGRPGPPLANVGNRIRPELLADYPNHAHSNAPGGRMPQYDLGSDDLRAIGACLQALKLPPAAGSSTASLPPGDPSRGAVLAEQGKCLGCHAVKKELQPEGFAKYTAEAGGASLRPGPSLANALEKLQAGALRRILSDTQREFPGSRMPQFRYTPQQTADLAAWLGLDDESAAAEPPATEPADGPILARGRDLLHKQGCSGCHLIPGLTEPPALPGPSLLEAGTRSFEQLPLEAAALPRLYDYFDSLLRDPGQFTSTPASMPRFALSERQRAALSIALLAEQPAPPPQYLLPLAEPGAGSAAAEFWPSTIPPQGSGPAWLSPLERDPQPRACAQCHARQFREWESSRHARSMGPGVTGQLLDWARSDPAKYMSCLRCHARLSEQQLLAEVRGADYVAASGMGTKARGAGYQQNPAFAAELDGTGHGCANCHSRAQQRSGVEPARSSYPWDPQLLSAHGLKRSAYLRESAFCADCHQFRASERVATGGPPLENTYAEWQAWVRTAAKPQSCQDCHMKDGSHSFPGIHDQDFVKKSCTISASHEFRDGRVQASLSLRNTNNGHLLPTYITPRIWLQGYFSDADGRTISDSWQDLMIGRDARTRDNGKGGTEWYDISDTRLAPDAAATLRYEAQIPAGAAAFHLEVFCAPDDFYHRAYGGWVADSERSEQGRSLLSQARAETAPESSGYYLYQEKTDISNLSSLATSKNSN